MPENKKVLHFGITQAANPRIRVYTEFLGYEINI